MAGTSQHKVVLILGGAGLVGTQVAHKVSRELSPDTVIIASLYQKEVSDLTAELRREFRHVKFVDLWGNLFVRRELALQGRKQTISAPESRRALYDDLFGPMADAYENSTLVSAILEHRPDVIIDCVNTASGISYQDVFTNSVEIRNALDLVESRLGGDPAAVVSLCPGIEQSIETLMVSQAIPQLIRHTQLLHRAMIEAATGIYIKVGTTGTGGMGLNIPYTHGEDRPSAKLMSKTAVAFAHTGLMFLMARTPGGPIVKEIKPGAMIGYKKVTYQPLRNKRNNSPVHIYLPRSQRLEGTLELSIAEDRFQRLGDLQMVGVDTGENGFFARGEFEAVTATNQMEFVTPEEIAQNVVLEIKGSNTGVDVIGAVDSAIMTPSYRAGYLRGSAIEALRRLERETHSHSVATGELGPPKLTKLLYEAYLLKSKYGSLEAVTRRDPASIAEELWRFIQRSQKLRNTVVSIGIPILPPDGDRLVRGPYISVPEYAGVSRLPVTRQNVELWAEHGWLDLRVKNVKHWQSRFRTMLRSAQTIHRQGSAAITMEAYRWEDIRIGEVVGWIFNNEEKGFRIK
jgi:hypothetical protein